MTLDGNVNRQVDSVVRVPPVPDSHGTGRFSEAPSAVPAEPSLPDSLRLQQTQEEVEQVKDIMLDNMEKANERSGKLNDLEQQAEDLLEKVAAGGAVQTGKPIMAANTVVWQTAETTFVEIIIIIIIIMTTSNYRMQ
uniref:V-SNARE coiled-coil homology domain-containing protein n=1 Tax=Xiphophorus maculatus TaxID=8083 RepID=M3ZP10_XIPMA